MAYDMNKSLVEEDISPDEINSSKTPHESSYANGTGVLGQARLAQALTKENIGWILILALAGEVFGITDKALLLLGGVC